MPREASLFTSSAGSVVRGYLKFRANIPSRWIKNAGGSRKRVEPEIAESFRSLTRLRLRRPRARVAIQNGQQELRSVLGSLGNSLPQRQLSSGNTNPLAGERLFHVIK